MKSSINSIALYFSICNEYFIILIKINVLYTAKISDFFLVYLLKLAKYCKFILFLPYISCFCWNCNSCSSAWYHRKYSMIVSFFVIFCYEKNGFLLAKFSCGWIFLAELFLVRVVKGVWDFLFDVNDWAVEDRFNGVSLFYLGSGFFSASLIVFLSLCKSAEDSFDFDFCLCIFIIKL